MHWYKYQDELVTDKEWVTDKPEDVDCLVCKRKMEEDD